MNARRPDCHGNERLEVDTDAFEVDDQQRRRSRLLLCRLKGSGRPTVHRPIATKRGLDRAVLWEDSEIARSTLAASR